MCSSCYIFLTKFTPGKLVGSFPCCALWNFRTEFILVIAVLYWTPDQAAWPQALAMVIMICACSWSYWVFFSWGWPYEASSDEIETLQVTLCYWCRSKPQPERLASSRLTQHFMLSKVGWVLKGQSSFIIIGFTFCDPLCVSSFRFWCFWFSITCHMRAKFT